MAQQAPVPAYGLKKISAVFFATVRGNEPVREWLKQDLSSAERKLVGEDIKTVELGWPIGMPTCRPMGRGLFEVRTNLPGKIARVLFYTDKHQRMVLLHGFIKKSQQTPNADMQLAQARMAQHMEGLKQ
jgi:phage-related protein